SRSAACACMTLSGLDSANFSSPSVTRGRRSAPPWAVSSDTRNPCAAKMPSSMPSWTAAVGRTGSTPMVTSVRSSVGTAVPRSGDGSSPVHAARTRAATAGTTTPRSRSRRSARGVRCARRPGTSPGCPCSSTGVSPVPFPDVVGTALGLPATEVTATGAARRGSTGRRPEAGDPSGLREGRRERPVHVLPEEDEPHELDVARPPPHRGHRDACDLGRVPAVDAGAHGGEGHRARPHGVRDVERAGEAGGEQRRVGLTAVPVRPHRVDHPPGRQVVPGGGHRLPDRQPVGQLGAPQLHALLEQPWTGGAVDRAVDPAPTQEGGVGGVDDGVDVLAGDVALHGFDTHDPIVPGAGTGTTPAAATLWTAEPSPPVGPGERVGAGSGTMESRPWRTRAGPRATRR